MFLHVPIEAVTEETPDMRLLRLSLAETPFGREHTTPGQHVRVKVDGRESYFALASAPRSDGRVELLVRRAPAGVAAGLWDKAAGDRVPMSAPEGRGFPLEVARGRDLILVAAGSGVGPLRAVIHWVLARREQFGRVTLFHGQRARDDFAFAREHSEWEAAGVRVVKVTSRDEMGERRLAGYVQHAILDVQPALENAVAFLSGMKEMIGPVTDALADLGLPRSHVFLNF